MTIAHGGNLFAVARERCWDWHDILDFSASINPLGPSPLVRPAIEAAMSRIVHYPDPYSSRLVCRLAAEWNVDPEQVLTGNGATDLIHFLARVWKPGHPVIAVPTFSEFFRAWPQAPTVAWDDPRNWPRDATLIVTQPNNPTGQLLPRKVFEREQPMLIDESFIEFTSAPSSIGGGHLVLRSLTKMHALPGLRVGALVGPPGIMRQLRMMREPWQVNVLAEAAAIAALDDRDHIAATKLFLDAERTRVARALSDIPGLQLHQSHANFFFAKISGSARALCAWMLEHKVLLRNCTGEPGIDGQCIRFAIRGAADNDRLIRLWRDFACA